MFSEIMSMVSNGNSSFALPGGEVIGNGRTFIIAEIGSNHASSLDTALASIDAAALTGADAVKFQSIDLDELYHEPSAATRALHAKIDLPEAWHAPLKQRCDDRGLVFLSSPTYLHAIDVLESVGVSLYKLASAQIAVFPQLVERVAKLGKPVILSTGLVTQEELDRVVKLFRDAGNEQFVILHCNSVYPAPAEIVHLPRLQDHARRYGCLVGFSDHTITNHAAVAAVAMGASVIERHFTLSRELDSPDAPLSLEPEEFTAFVAAVREADVLCRPSPRSTLEPDEAGFKARIGHCLVTTRPVVAGEKVDEKTTVLKRGHTDAGVDAWFVFERPQGLKFTRPLAAGAWLVQEDVISNFAG